jgi:serine-type D-Ala-D-Ala carboxypeptidase (penicillin-binding protein 5/6)
MPLPRLVVFGVLWLAAVVLVVPVLPRPGGGLPTAAPAAQAAPTAAPTGSASPVMRDFTRALQAVVDTASSAWAMPEVAALAVPDRSRTPRVAPPPTDGQQAITVSARFSAPPASEPVLPPPPPEVSASAAVVVDDASLAVLYGKHEHERRGPASLTKLATAALAVQFGDVDSTVESTVDSRLMPGSSLMGLLPGETYSMEDLLYGLLLVSGNDAARVIAREVAGTEARFVHWMNEMCRQIGLEDTRFVDPHGLGGPGHYSSAFDMALLARYAMQFEDVARISVARGWTTSGSRPIALHNFVNGFLSSYPGAEGLKTGFTTEAGPTFVGAATRDGRRLYVVLLNSQDRFGEAAALLDWAFDSHAWPAPPR